MATSRSLTGGTGDVNPQMMVITGTQANADDNVNMTVVLPFMPGPAGKNQATVVEVLKVRTHFRNMANWIPNAGQVPVNAFARLGTQIDSNGNVDNDAPSTFYEEEVYQIDNEIIGSTNQMVFTEVFTQDFMDNAGISNCARRCSKRGE